MSRVKPCSISGCGSPSRKRKLCYAHYKSLRRYGDPLAAKTRPERRGKPLRPYFYEVSKAWFDLK